MPLAFAKVNFPSFSRDQAALERIAGISGPEIARLQQIVVQRMIPLVRVQLDVCFRAAALKTGSLHKSMKSQNGMLYRACVTEAIIEPRKSGFVAMMGRGFPKNIYAAAGALRYGSIRAQGGLNAGTKKSLKKVFTRGGISSGGTHFIPAKEPFFHFSPGQAAALHAAQEQIVEQVLAEYLN